MRPTREMRPRPFVQLGLGQAITSVSVSSNSLGLGNVIVQNAAGSNYHFVSTSSNTGIWVPHEDGDEAETPIDHGNMGATETIDVGQGTWHRGTLTANVAVTVLGFSVDSGVVALLEFTQDGTGGWDITWDSDVEFSGDDQPDQTASAVTFFLLFTSRGDATIYGAKVGGAGGGGDALDDLSDVTITSPQEDDTLRYVGGVWINDDRRWEAVTNGEDVFVWDGNDLVHEWKEY